MPLLQEKSHPKSLISENIQMMQIGFTDFEKNTMCDMVVCTKVRRTSHQEQPPRVPTSRGVLTSELRHTPAVSTPHRELSYAISRTELRHIQH